MEAWGASTDVTCLCDHDPDKLASHLCGDVTKGETLSSNSSRDAVEKDALDLCAERGDDADAIPFPKLMKKAVLKAHRSRHLPQMCSVSSGSRVSGATCLTSARARGRKAEAPDPSAPAKWQPRVSPDAPRWTPAA